MPAGGLPSHAYHPHPCMQALGDVLVEASKLYNSLGLQPQRSLLLSRTKGTVGSSSTTTITNPRKKQQNIKEARRTAVTSSSKRKAATTTTTPFLHVDNPINGDCQIYLPPDQLSIYVTTDLPLLYCTVGGRESNNR